MSVDLPAPFSPIKAWISPANTVRSTARSALMPKKDFETPRISRIGSFIVPPGAQCVSHPRPDRFVSAVHALNKRPRRRAIPNTRECNIEAMLVARPIQFTPCGKPLGIGIDQAGVGFERLDALRPRAYFCDRLTGDSKPPQSRRTERRAGFTSGK